MVEKTDYESRGVSFYDLDGLRKLREVEQASWAGGGGISPWVQDWDSYIAAAVRCCVESFIVLDGLIWDFDDDVVEGVKTTTKHGAYLVEMIDGDYVIGFTNPIDRDAFAAWCCAEERR